MYFQEEQRFRQWWLWLILIGINLIPAYGIYKQIFRGQIFGDNPMSDVGLIIFQLFTLLFLLAFWQLKLVTRINEDEIYIQFYPLVKRSINWSEVKSAKMVNYGFVGGWGIRLTSKYGTVYNTSGNMGLLLELEHGEKICIGTQKPDELAGIAEQYANNLIL